MIKEFSINLTHEELEKRVHKDYLVTKELLSENSPEYLSLLDGDKKALKYLVCAASILDRIEMQLDNHYNLNFQDYLINETQKNNEDAKLAKILFDAQRGICALDRNSEMVELAKDIHETEKHGYYPIDLTKEEFHNILIKMIDEGKIEAVKSILNQRSVVERDGKYLKAIDFIDKFNSDFKEISRLLRHAALYSSNKDFNEYLELQAKALESADPMLDAYADEKWATLQDTPLEFTITREGYQERFTESVLENEILKKLLAANNISVLSKDSLGCRVGIVNKIGTENILSVKAFLPEMAEYMPFSNEYVQVISKGDIKQTMVDVDLVSITGEVGAFRAGITLAENLPNDDKLSIKVLNAGRRNVYHRQIRLASSQDSKEKQKKILDGILDENFHKFYNKEADHWFTIGHENGHSLGPKEGTEALGKYRSIIEENKADMISLSMLDLLVEKKLYTEEQKKQIIVTYVVDNMLLTKPLLSQAHRVRSVMQNYFFLKEKAFSISDEGKIIINFDNFVSVAKKMLSKIIRVQLEGQFNLAEEYVNDNFIWNEQMQKVADIMKSISKVLNGRVVSPLAEKLLLEDLI